MFQGHANQFKCTYRKVAIRELFLNERQKGGRENVSVFGGVHDPREDHKLYGSLCRYSSPPLEFSCLCLYFSFLGVFFRKLILLWYCSWIVDSSVNITLSNISFSLMRSLHQSSLLVLLASHIAWQYRAFVKLQLRSFLTLVMVLTLFTVNVKLSD